jgi:hypothetical protein
VRKRDGAGVLLALSPTRRLAQVDEKLFKGGNFHVRSVPRDVDIFGLDVFAFSNVKDNGLLATPEAHKFIRAQPVQIFALGALEVGAKIIKSLWRHSLQLFSARLFFLLFNLKINKNLSDPIQKRAVNFIWGDESS